jgi:hypothetical protein
MFLTDFPGKPDRFISPIEGFLLHDFPLDAIKVPEDFSLQTVRNLIGNTQHCKAVALAVSLGLTLLGDLPRQQFTARVSKSQDFHFHEFQCRKGELKLVAMKKPGRKSLRKKADSMKDKRSRNLAKPPPRQNLKNGAKRSPRKL